MVLLDRDKTSHPEAAQSKDFPTSARALLTLVVAPAEELVLHSCSADWRAAQGRAALGQWVFRPLGGEKCTLPRRHF